MGEWRSLKDLQSPELQRLVTALPSTLVQSKAPSTAKKYLGAFRRWKLWASDHKLPAFPAKPIHVTLYLQHLGESSASKASAEEAVNGLAWAHSLAGIESPTSNPLVKNTLEGLKRALARPVQKKAPFTIEMIQAIVKDTEQNDSLANVRLATMCLLAFAGFLRFDELSNIHPCDLGFEEDYVKLHIPKSKTDQFRQGTEVLLAKTGSATCPVAMLERYLVKAKISLDSQLFLFRPIIAAKPARLRDSGKLTYSRVREIFKQKLEQLGLPSEAFGLHSLRAGGATAAAKAGIPDRIFKRHGRWKSENAKDGYVEDRLSERLAVSQKLGL